MIMSMIPKINIALLERVKSYCDKRCYKSSFGFDLDSRNWDDSTVEGLIGSELFLISVSIQRIFELLISDYHEISK